MQKLLPILLLISLGAKGQTPNFAPPDSLRQWLREHANYSLEPLKRDTVKCWVITTQWHLTNGDSLAHLVLTKSWVVREYHACWIRNGQYEEFGRCPYPIKYLHANKRDSLSVVGDFKPIIQEWR